MTQVITGGVAPDIPFTYPTKFPSAHYECGPINNPWPVKLLGDELSGFAPLVGFVYLPDGTVGTVVWKRDGSHASMDVRWTLRDAMPSGARRALLRSLESMDARKSLEMPGTVRNR